MKMTSWTKRWLIIGGIILTILAVYLVTEAQPKRIYTNEDNSRVAVESASESEVTPPAQETNDEQVVTPPQVLHRVPFVSQAPFGDWSDPRQQDGCEETSILMASYWLQGKTALDKQVALDEILKLSAAAEAKFGAYQDSSAKDTLILMQSYFNYNKGFVEYDIDAEDIKKQLAKGNLVIVPADGRKLNNPYFSGEGPDRHMLVVIGYDDAQKHFITNDPGTRSGTSYRYSYDTLLSSVSDYPTGNHLQLFNNRRAMIVVEKA